MKTNSYAAQSATTPLAPFNFQRRDLGKDDVQIDILYCGVCHSDLHTVRSEWGGTNYPCVPDHEIIGRVIAVGEHVKKFKAGDTAGVGCMVESCRACANCEEDLEQFCDATTFTYNSPKRLGADEFVNSKNVDEMKKHLNSSHFILDTVSAQHDINAYLVLLKRDGNLTQVGVPAEPLSLSVGSLIYGRRSLSGSLIGGIKETQETLDFCGEHNITADIELIPIQKINEAYDRLVKSDVKYRFVIDMASLQQAA
jgi:D-arabinose 1-dehydrogenase-like Zn-dependent alcohol dehydrogenase